MSNQIHNSCPINSQDKPNKPLKLQKPKNNKNLGGTCPSIPSYQNNNLPSRQLGVNQNNGYFNNFVPSDQLPQINPYVNNAQPQLNPYINNSPQYSLPYFTNQSSVPYEENILEFVTKQTKVSLDTTITKLKKDIKKNIKNTHKASSSKHKKKIYKATLKEAIVNLQSQGTVIINDGFNSDAKCIGVMETAKKIAVPKKYNY